jgi:hypothetical protein
VVDEQGCTVCTLVEGEGDMEGGGRRWHRGEGRSFPVPPSCDHLCARSVNSASHGPGRSTPSCGSFPSNFFWKYTYCNTGNRLVRAARVSVYLLLYELGQNMEGGEDEVRSATIHSFQSLCHIFSLAGSTRPDALNARRPSRPSPPSISLC